MVTIPNPPPEPVFGPDFNAQHSAVAAWERAALLSIKGSLPSGPTDATPGKFLLNGAFGLGADAGPVVANVDTHHTAGFYSGYGGGHAAPAGGDNPFSTMNGAFGLLVGNSTVSEADDYVWQIAIDVSGGNGTKYRARGNAGWTSWRRYLASDEVQADPTDATADKLLKVGAFGWGAGVAVRSTGNFLETQLPGGAFRTGNLDSTTGAPPGATYRGTVGLTLPALSGTHAMLLMNAMNVSSPEDNNLWLGVKSTGGAAPQWSRFYSDSNILGTVSQSAGVPRGAIIERGSNGNGEYVRFADGTQICEVLVNMGDPTATGSGTFADPYTTNSTGLSFPALFVAPPKLGLFGTILNGSAPLQNRIFSFSAAGISASAVTALRAHRMSAGADTSDCTIYMTAIGRWN